MPYDNPPQEYAIDFQQRPLHHERVFIGFKACGAVVRFGVCGVVGRIGYLWLAPGLLPNGMSAQAQLLGKLEAMSGEVVSCDANKYFCLKWLRQVAIKTCIYITQVNHRQIPYETGPSIYRSSTLAPPLRRCGNNPNKYQASPV